MGLLIVFMVLLLSEFGDLDHVMSKLHFHFTRILFDSNCASTFQGEWGSGIKLRLFVDCIEWIYFNFHTGNRNSPTPSSKLIVSNAQKMIPLPI